ncbi:MAG: nucleotide sugar dehydrogenase [Chloroflexota bacterium]
MSRHPLSATDVPDLSMNTICLLGLGYIGLPTGSMFALAGKSVIGVDPNPGVQAALRSGLASFDEPELQTLVTAAINSGRLRVQTHAEVADAFIIAVPTPLDPATNRADLRFVEQAARDIVPVLRRGNLVVLESTVPPGTTRDVLAPILAESGLAPGRDICVAHCPERVLPGRILIELEQNDRLAGGLTPRCAHVAAELYSAFVKGAIMRTDATTAEMVKVMENTFRDVNVALANEFALIAERIGVDVWEAIRLANHHPRVSVLRPGPGVGGHCIAVDPWFLVDAAPEEARLIRTARSVNDAMPEHVVARLEALVSPPATIALLGVTYKAEVDDVRESPALRVAELAAERGYSVRLCDPHVKAHTTGLPGPILPFEQALRDAEAIVLLVDHRAFKELDVDLAAALVGSKRVLDARGALDRPVWQARGFEVSVLGAGTQVADRAHAERSSA